MTINSDNEGKLVTVLAIFLVHQLLCSHKEVEGVKFIGDDIILITQHEAKLLKMLESYLKIKSLGFKFEKDKCIFITDKLNLYGIEI